jgi:uncharacterized oxidoreductase
MQNDIEQGFVDTDSSVVLDEAKLAEPVHEEADARTSGSDHLRQRFLCNSWNTNVLGPMRLTAALIGQFMAQPQAAILNVSSALAMMPAAMMPSYCASKAAINSYTQSLRYQLRNTSIQVIEIIPPWVQTELQGERGMNPKAMPLRDYIAETMATLNDSPESTEIVSERSKQMRFAERGDYDAFFSRYNEGWLASQER